MRRNLHVTIAAYAIVTYFFVAADAWGEVTLVTDPLTSETSCSGPGCTVTVENGTFVAEGGFQTGTRDDRVVYDLGYGVDCGYAEVQVTNFNPPEQFRGSEANACVFIFAAFEESHITYKRTEGGDDSVIVTQATHDGTFRDGRLKYHACPCRADGCEFDVLYLPRSGEIDWRYDEVYTIGIEWELTGHGEGVARLFLSAHGDDYTGRIDWAWYAGHPNPVPGMRYIVVGRDRHGAALECGGWLDGPIFSNVTVVDYECGVPAPPDEDDVEPVPDAAEIPEEAVRDGVVERVEVEADAAVDDAPVEDVPAVEADAVVDASGDPRADGSGTTATSGCSCAAVA